MKSNNVYGAIFSDLLSLMEKGGYHPKVQFISATLKLSMALNDSFSLSHLTSMVVKCFYNKKNAF